MRTDHVTKYNGLCTEKGHKHRRDSVHVLLDMQATVQTQEV